MNISIKGLTRGLIVTGVVGFVLAVLSVYLYMLLINLVLALDFPLFMLISVTAASVVVYFLIYFVHVCVDSAILLYELRKNGLRGVDTCVQN